MFREGVALISYQFKRTNENNKEKGKIRNKGEPLYQAADAQRQLKMVRR